jgi:DnaJ-domain-containing protein 1
MTRDDALKLFGLSEQASRQAIERRYHELYNDYHLRLIEGEMALTRSQESRRKRTEMRPC